MEKVSPKSNMDLMKKIATWGVGFTLLFGSLHYYGVQEKFLHGLLFDSTIQKVYAQQGEECQRGSSRECHIGSPNGPKGTQYCIGEPPRWDFECHLNEEEGEGENLEDIDEEGGKPITKSDIENKCLDGSVSKILEDVINAALDEVFNYFSINSDVPTENETLTFQQIGVQVEACTRDLIQKSSKVMLQNLKKRLMDQLVNQTIDWINNEREPKYVSNFWDFTEEALNTAAGDVIRELDLAKLYPDENLKNYIISAVQERSRERSKRFSENISFDLDKEVDDPEAFKEDFTQGGFTGLIVASDLKNNPAGAAFMAGVYLNAKENQELAQAASQTTGDGFTADVACTTWVLVKKSDKPSGVGGAYRDPATGKEKKVTFPPEKAPNVNNPPPDETINGVTYRYLCEDQGKIVKTPSGVVQAVAETAVTQQFDYVLSSDDINSYVSQIASAAVNRLMRDGIAFFGSSKGTNSNYLPSGFSQKQNQYNENYSGEGVQNQSKLLTRANLIPRAEKLITDSSSTLGNTSAQGSILWFEARANFMERSLLSTTSPVGLVECMNMRPGFSPTNYPPGCTIAQIFPPQSGNCKIQFTGKTIQALRTEMLALANTTRATVTSRKNESTTVFNKMAEILPSPSSTN